MSAKNPFDPFGVGAASVDVWRAMMTSPGGLLEAQAELAKSFADAVKGDATAAATAKPPGKPIVEPAAGDRRVRPWCAPRNAAISAAGSPLASTATRRPRRARTRRR